MLDMIATDSRELMLISEARQFLAEASSIDTVKDVIDKAEAVRMYCKKAGEGLEAQNAAAEIRLLAIRRAAVGASKLTRKASNHVDAPDPVSYGLVADQDHMVYWACKAFCDIDSIRPLKLWQIARGGQCDSYRGDFERIFCPTKQADLF